MPRVFISHSTQDHDFVEREILAYLRQHGVETWYSKFDIETADHWEQTIQVGLESCDWFLVVLMSESVASKWVCVGKIIEAKSAVPERDRSVNQENSPRRA
jgi:TIR domain